MTQQLLLTGARNVEAAIFRANFLEAVRTSNLAQNFSVVERLFRGDMGGIDPGGGFYVNGIYPTWAWQRYQGNAFFWLSGVANFTQGARFWDDVVGSRFDLSAVPRVRYLDEWAAFIVSRVQNQGEVMFDRTVICGHSIGGACAFYLAEKLRAAGFPGEQQVTSFGAPRHGAFPVAGFVSALNTCRWMNSNDPLPTIPPRLSVGQRFWAGYSTTQAQRMSSFVHSAGGVSIGLTGIRTPSALPVAPPDPDFNSIRGWIAARDSDLLTPHSLPVYASQIRQGFPVDLPPPVVVEVPTPVIIQNGAPAETRVRRAPDEVARVIQESVQTVFLDETRRNREPLRIPSTAHFTIGRQGRIYFVVLNGVPISVAPTRRRARALARVGNDFLRRLQRQGLVATDDFVGALYLYLVNASTVDGGFSPLLNQ